MLNRRAGAPRLIEWTGERAVPWSPDPNVAYEHHHRYLWAQSLVDGRRVLDLGSGEGYGSALLAETAASVVGVDIDLLTLEHSRLNYAAPSLTFEVASATDLGRFPDNSFDAVVAFEILEHVDDQKAMLAEIHRVLTADGLAVLSTPDRRAYTDATGTKNPYHVHELSEEELREALGEYFEEVCLFGQRPATGSRIEALDQVAPSPSRSFTLARHGGDWMQAGAMSPLYLIAVASASKLPVLAPESTLSDYELGMLRDAEAAREITLGEVARLEQQLAASATQLDVAADERARLEAHLAVATDENTRLEDELAGVAADVAELESELITARRQLTAACIDESSRSRRRADAALVSAALAATGQPDDGRRLDEIVGALRAEAEGFRAMQASRSYRTLTRSLRALGGLAPPGTRRRALGRRIVHGRAPAGTEAEAPS